MPEQEQPRCPYCDRFRSLYRCFEDGKGGKMVWASRCENHKCMARFNFKSDTEDECRTLALDMKLVDRLVREAVDAEREACADVAWEHVCKGHHDNCDCSGEISLAIQALNKPDTAESEPEETVRNDSLANPDNQWHTNA